MYMGKEGGRKGCDTITIHTHTRTQTATKTPMKQHTLLYTHLGNRIQTVLLTYIMKHRCCYDLTVLYNKAAPKQTHMNQRLNGICQRFSIRTYVAKRMTVSDRNYILSDRSYVLHATFFTATVMKHKLYYEVLYSANVICDIYAYIFEHKSPYAFFYIDKQQRKYIDQHIAV